MASYINSTLKDRQTFYGTPLPASPRISFSNDFAVELQPPPRDIVIPDPSFEFAVGVRPMIAADELFFKGRMLPLTSGPSARITTLDPPKRFVRWKELLRLKWVNSGSSARKNDKADNSSAATDTAGEICREIYSGSEKTIVL